MIENLVGKKVKIRDYKDNFPALFTDTDFKRVSISNIPLRGLDGKIIEQLENDFVIVYGRYSDNDYFCLFINTFYLDIIETEKSSVASRFEDI